MDIPIPLQLHHHPLHHLNNPDSAESSPRSRPGDTWPDEPLPSIPGAKLRLMCSYGGHIIPRPHDKSLCYVGGDTRMVVIDRNSLLSSFSTRLSKTLINGRSFTLKYQLPNEDLDSLISVTTDEDLENMIEENDRINSSSSKPARLRLFLFPNKPETAISMGSLINDAKSENWFVDALNNAALSRGESESATMDCLVEIDDADIENQNVQSITTDASFDSSSSSPSVAYLKPIKVRIDQEQMMMVGIDDQLSNLNLEKKDEELVVLSANPPLPTQITTVTAAVSNDYVNRDNERLLDHRKPPLPLQLVQRKKGLASDVHHNLPSSDFSLTSPDSVASDSSITSAASFSKQNYNQDSSAPPQPQPPPHMINPTSPNESNHFEPPTNSQQQIVQQIIQQPQFIQQTPTHYIDHLGHPHPIMSLPPSNYYTMQPNNNQQPSQVYFLQPFNQSQNQNQPFNTYPISDSPSPNRPSTPAPNPSITVSPNVYIAAAPTVQPTPNQYQPQYLGLPQNYYLSQSVTAGSASGGSNYQGFDQYNAHSGLDDQQTAYHSPTMFTPQYHQTINPATAMLLAQANSVQVPNSDNKTS
ncbi:uncharacterized protein LOC124942232 [Impatiens glandulifera]|uniref:uncharacterized protein LOC124942232 n=1 Tax=Impatiens glandulifera TaxID=253017 RepID=UPI001FB10DA8|nr:uncharacterized protein LOC124942232 [Impatiens glandulifera]